MKWSVFGLATLFIAAMVGSLFQVSTGQSVFASSNCPDHVDTSTLCPVAAVSELGEWQVTFLATVTSAWTLLALLIVVAVFRPQIFPQLSFTQRWCRMLYEHQSRVRTAWYAILYTTRSHTVRPWQALFAAGILHPKTF